MLVALALGKHDRWLMQLAVRELLEQVIDAVEPCAFLIDGLHDPPARLGYVRALDHYFLGFRVVLPTSPRLEVHRTELPLLQGIVNAPQESQMLFLVGDREPVLEQADSRAYEHALELRYGAEELFVLVGRAEIHHLLDARAVVPASVE